MASPFFCFIAYTFVILDGYRHHTIYLYLFSFNGSKNGLYLAKQSIIILYFYLKYNSKKLIKWQN